jgi:hypothetical protein
LLEVRDRIKLRRRGAFFKTGLVLMPSHLRIGTANRLFLARRRGLLLSRCRFFLLAPRPQKLDHTSSFSADSVRVEEEGIPLGD